MKNKRAVYTTTATKVIQKGQVLYYASLPSEVLVEHTDVHHWDSNKTTRKGYQRNVNKKKVYQIRDFVLHSDALLPQNITLCTNNTNAVNFVQKERLIKRGKNGYKRHKFDEASWVGDLKLYNNTKLWILDGQHRTAGLKAAIARNDIVKDFPISVVIIENITEAKQKEIFLTTNNTSWKLQKDLSLQLQTEAWQNPKTRNKAHIYDRDWQIKGTQLGNMLNKDSDSMWYNRIQMPNATKEQSQNSLIKQSTWVYSCRRLYSGEGAKRGVGLEFAYFSEEDQAKLMSSYWNAIADTWPEQVFDPKKYSICSTPMYAINSVLPSVYFITKDKYGEANRQNISYVLEHMKENLHPEFWDNDSENGAVIMGKDWHAVTKMINILRDALPKKTL